MAQVEAAGKGSKKLHHMRVYPTKNGGHTIEHHFGEMTFQTPDSYSFGPGNSAEALAHVAKFAGMDMKADNSEPTPSDVEDV